MLKVIIIEDELNAVNTLSSYLGKYLSEVKLVGVAHSKADGIALINATDFDLVLLDINLGDGTGFEVLEGCNTERTFSVIFTTAYDEYAIKAFKYSALDYLLKPIDPKEFIAAVNRVGEQQKGLQKAQLEYASGVAETGNGNRIVVNSSNEIHFIPLSDILRLESYSNYTDIYLQNGSKVTSTKTLKFYEQLLSDSGFFRIHQKHLVPLSCVVKFLKEDGGYVLLKDDSKLEVSRRKKEELLNKLLT